MKAIQTQIENLAAGREPQDGEYRNPEDGLIYCKACHTPRQIRIAMFGKESTPSVLCRCQQEQQDREQPERKRQERMMWIEHLRTEGLQDKLLRDCTFQNDLGYNPEISKAHAYAEHFEELEVSSTGLLLWGNVGTGKTFIAGCIANALIDRGIRVLMTNFAKLLNALTGMRPEERNAYIDNLDFYRLLIIDDLGMERGTEFAQEQVFHVIDNRYRSRKPIIVTTNLTLQELKRPPDLARERIYSRVLERCVPVKINGRNIRVEIAAEQLEIAKRILGTS